MWPLAGLLFLLQHALTSSTPHYCVKCASENVLENWGRYGLPLSVGEEMVADSHCHDGGGELVACLGHCYSLNVTREHEGRRLLLGVLRGCERSTVKRHLPTNPTCSEQRRQISRRVTVDLKFCFCQGDRCNAHEGSVQRRFAARRPLRPSLAVAQTSGSLLAALSVLFFAPL